MRASSLRHRSYWLGHTFAEIAVDRAICGLPRCATRATLTSVSGTTLELGEEAQPRAAVPSIIRNLIPLATILPSQPRAAALHDSLWLVAAYRAVLYE